MTSAPSPSFLARVRNGLDSFHPMERQLAEFVLDFPGDLASYAASELAALAGVSNATVSRFIKRLGYQHYDEARRQVREEREQGSPLYRASRSAPQDAAFAQPLQRGQDNLARTLARLTPDTLDPLAQALLQARKLWMVGFRSSQSFASYFRWQLYQLKEEIEVVPQAGDTLGQTLASLRPQDVVVLFALRRRPAGLPVLLDRFLASGAQVLYITDAHTAHDSRVRWHLQCFCDAASPLDDHAAVAALCHLIAARAFDLAGPAARARLRAIESSHGDLHEL